MKIVTDLSLLSRPMRPRTLAPQPSLLLDFVSEIFKPAGFGTVVSYARAGEARYHDASGQMQVAGPNTPRMDHARGTGQRRGFLIEDARTNLFLQSGAPVTQSISVTAQTYTLSFWGAGSVTLSGAHSDTLMGFGGDVRAALIFNPSAGALTLTLSGNIQLVQLEVGNCPTSYIPTSTTAVTRPQDQVSMTLGSWWNPSEGTFVIEWQDINQQPGNTRILGLPNSQTAMNLTGGSGPGGNQTTYLEMWNGSGSVAAISPGDITKGIRKGIAAYSGAGRAVVVNGIKAEANSPLFTGPTPDTLYLGAAIGGGASINGCLRRVAYYPQRLADANLLLMAQ